MSNNQHYESMKRDIPKSADHKEYERRAKEAARKAGV
jgi:hypothetical protein